MVQSYSWAYNVTRTDTGGPVGGSLVEVWGDSNKMNFVQSCYTDSNGNAFFNLLPGTYYVLVLLDGFAFVGNQLQQVIVDQDHLTNSGRIEPLQQYIGDAYVTVADADSRFLNHPLATGWSSLTSDQKYWYILEATRHIDKLPLKGDRYYWWDPVKQRNEFPRIIDGVAHDWSIPTATIHVPQRVIDACFEEALTLFRLYTSSEFQERLDIQQQGVTSNKQGDVSENYKPDAGRRFKGLFSLEAFNLMKGYIAGSVESRYQRSIIIVDGTSSSNEMPPNSR